MVKSSIVDADVENVSWSKIVMKEFVGDELVQTELIV